jgi:hypothetical protein
VRTAAILVITAGIASAAQQPARSLADVLARLDAYLQQYETTLATIVAEERYSQALEERRQAVPGDREERRQAVPGDREERRQAVPGDRELAAQSATGRQTRTLVSDYALARSPGGHAWTGFRDTYEVDGQPVRDREDRLLALMADGSESAASQALRISRDNARHNLGEDVVSRTINVPTVALDLVHRRHRSRMSFEKRGEEVVDGTSAWVLTYRERDRPTILRTPDGKDRRVRGAVWVDPVTGEVLRTDLSWDGAPSGFIVVHYRRDERIGALVPDMMLEEYRGAKGLLTGRATYTNYRRFQTAARVVPSPGP